ncbi:hypothetical protein K438DRAFT_1927364 [Mycena galopus ATCC 62051]|nr:hypothetical protein K438DRAFT_1927364 [Mycena galopus ATCC 62051]
MTLCTNVPRPESVVDWDGIPVAALIRFEAHHNLLRSLHRATIRTVGGQLRQHINNSSSQPWAWRDLAATGEEVQVVQESRPKSETKEEHGSYVGPLTQHLTKRKAQRANGSSMEAAEYVQQRNRMLGPDLTMYKTSLDDIESRHNAKEAGCVKSLLDDAPGCQQREMHCPDVKGRVDCYREAQRASGQLSTSEVMVVREWWSTKEERATESSDFGNFRYLVWVASLAAWPLPKPHSPPKLFPALQYYGFSAFHTQ